VQNNSKATSTITGIIDGTGSLGTACGQFVVGRTIDMYGWLLGYWLVLTVDISVTALPLMKIFVEDVAEVIRLKKKGNDVTVEQILMELEK
jgi:sugar phosphate permease